MKDNVLVILISLFLLTILFVPFIIAVFSHPSLEALEEPKEKE